MATRMQQRRGTAAQWISTNSGNGPVLNAGEIGFEIDNNRFKIGDGVNHWVDLPYFSDNQSLTDLIDGAPDLLNTLGELAGALGDDPTFFTTVATNLSNHQSDTTNIHGITDTAALATKTYADNAVSTHSSDTTNVHGIADTADLATQDYVTDAIANSTDAYPDLVGDGLAWNAIDETFEVDSTVARVDSVQEIVDLKANINSPTFTGTVSGIDKSMVGLSNVDNTSDANKPVSTATQTALDLRAPKSNPVFIGTVTSTNDVVINGNLTVNGTNFAASATSITIEDNMLQLAHENPANTVDLGVVVSYNDGTAKHSGIIRDASANRWRFFKDVTTEPTTTIDFTQAAFDDLQIATLIADSATIGNVTEAEMQYLAGVTSDIQDQLDDKLGSATAATTYAPIANPTFTGTVSGVTKAHVGLNNVDNSADLDKPVSDLTQAALDLKAPLANPTFTGTVSGIDKSMVGLGNVNNTADASKPISDATQTALDDKANIDGPTLTGIVTLPSSTSIGDVTSTEIGYLEGVTSAIQNQLDDRPTEAELTKSMVGLENVDNTSDEDKPVSTDTQAALDLKADLDAPTFTGIVSGITKSMVGLGSVDNTADADKPISDDTQAALDLKAPLANPTFTGTVSGITKSMVELGSVDNTSDANKPISTATQNALDLKAPLNSPTFTGTVTLPANTISQSMMGDDSVGTNEIGGLAVTTEKLADGAVTNAKVSASAAIDWTKLAISSTVSATEAGYLDGVTSAIQTQLNAKAPLAAPSFTGEANFESNVTIEGNLVVEGTTTTVNTSEVQIDDPIFYLSANQYDANTRDIGITGAYGTVGGDEEDHLHTGLVKDVTDGKWKLFSNAPHPVNNVVDFTSANYDTLKVGSIEASSATIGDVSNTELQYLNGVTSAVQTQIDAKAPLASPTFTGTVTIPNGAALGTPASGTLTNATGLPVASGISGLGTGVATFLATPSSANLASMLTDEIGTGSVVLSEVATSAQTASYTLVAADKAKMVEMNVASANNVTVPPNSSVAFPVGTKIDILQVGAGQTTIVAGAGVTVNATPGLKIRAQWGSATLIKRAENTWVLVGDLSA
jgi:hypothetical protein